VTEPSSSSAASTISTALVVSECIIVAAMVTNRNLEQRGPDHDVRAHAEDVEHRRDENEPAADAHQHCQNATTTPISSGASGEM
jgi:hypothetical protein